jgi:hypothetical protein
MLDVSVATNEGVGSPTDSLRATLLLGINYITSYTVIETLGLL